MKSEPAPETQSALEELLGRLNDLADPAWIKGMKHGGIQGGKLLGVSMPNIRLLARRKKDHNLALALWETGIHEARLLAALIDQPAVVTSRQMDMWTAQFDSWDVCDQVCGNLYVKTPFAVTKALEWAATDAEFTKRAGFALMAYLAVHDKKSGDEVFERFLVVIENSATDNRNFVKKAVNWALRQIGKRNAALYQLAFLCSQRLASTDNPTARWVGKDALQELESPSALIRKRLGV